MFGGAQNQQAVAEKSLAEARETVPQLPADDGDNRNLRPLELGKPEETTQPRSLGEG